MTDRSDDPDPPPIPLDYARHEPFGRSDAGPVNRLHLAVGSVIVLAYFAACGWMGGACCPLPFYFLREVPIPARVAGAASAILFGVGCARLWWRAARRRE